MKIKIISAILFLTGSILFAKQVTIPEDSHFYNPKIGSYQQTVQMPTGNNHASLIQEAINSVHDNGGGTLIINAKEDKNVYIINKEVQIKSGVHIRVNPDVIFQSTSPDKITVFSAGKKEKKRTVNFSLGCTNPEKYFVFDFTNRQAGVRAGGAIAVSVGGVRNFKISDIRVKDNFTPYSCITVNLSERIDGKYLFAKDGIIEHLTADKGHYGYGLIQCQAANNVLYRDLDGEGGAALRLETGAIGKANLADRSIFIDMVYGKNIKCKNGQAALTLSPHTVNNGKVFIDNLLANSCEAGAIIASGFLSGKKGQKGKDGNAINGYTYGYFDSESIVSNLKIIYGTNAQLRPQRRAFVPCSQKHLIHAKKNPDEESYKGPTVAGIVYFAKGGTNIDNGFYTVQTPGLVMKNFPLVKEVQENKEYVTSPKEGIRDCGDKK